MTVLTRKGLLLGFAGAFAGSAARHLDPEGEPVLATQAVIEVNAPGVTISNVSIDARGSRRHAAIALNKASHGVITGSTIQGGDF